MLSPELARLMSAVAGRPDVTIGRTLSDVGLMTGGKLFAFVRDGALVLKLPADRIDSLIESHQGRRDRDDWVAVPASAAADWPALTRDACDFVSGRL